MSKFLFLNQLNVITSLVSDNQVSWLFQPDHYLDLVVKTTRSSLSASSMSFYEIHNTYLIWIFQVIMVVEAENDQIGNQLTM